MSGMADITLNSGNITRQVEDFASQTGLSLDDIRKQPLNLTNVGSLFVANGETAAITIPGEQGPVFHSVRLDNPHGMLALIQAHRKLDDPAAIAEMFDTQSDGLLPRRTIMKEIKADRASWARPSPFRRMISALWDDTGNDRWAKIREPLDLTARVLAASPQSDINLSGPCHLAFKATNVKTGQADIVVCPTFRCEQRRIIAFQSGKHALPEGKLTAAALRKEIVRATGSLLLAGRIDQPA